VNITIRSGIIACIVYASLTTTTEKATAQEEKLPVTRVAIEQFSMAPEKAIMQLNFSALLGAALGNSPLNLKDDNCSYSIYDRDDSWIKVKCDPRGDIECLRAVTDPLGWASCFYGSYRDKDFHRAAMKVCGCIGVLTD